MTGSDATALFELLRDYRRATPEERLTLVATATQRYGAERTILIGDMTGFTRRVVAEGIVHYLSLIVEMRAVCQPLVAAAGGYLYKAEADNIFAAFVRPADAVRSALQIQRRLHELNVCCPVTDRIQLGLGLATGPVLAVGTEDVWGTAVNFASKLGEDLSQPGEILVHESLEESLRQLQLPLEALEAEVSGAPLRYFRVGRA